MRAGHATMGYFFKAVQEYLFEHFTDRHSFVLGQVGHEGGEALFKACFEGNSFDFHFRFAHGNAVTESKDVLVGIAHVHFAKAPGFVLGGTNHLGSDPRDSFKVIVHVIYENAEPGAGLPLAFEAKEDFDLVQADCAEGWRVTPIPKPIKEQFLRVIIHRFREIADREDGSQTFSRDLWGVAHK